MKYFFGISLLLFLCFGCKKPKSEVELADALRNASSLVAAEYVFSKVVVATQNRKLLDVIPLNQATFLANSEAVLKTGIDVNKLNASDIQIKGGQINIELPPIEVIDFAYPANKFVENKEYTHLHPFANNLSISDLDLIFQEAQIQLIESIDHLDIVETSENKVSMVVTNLLQLEGFERVFVSFRKSDSPLLAVPPEPTKPKS